MHFLTRTLIENQYINQYNLELNRYNALFKELVEAHGFDMVLSVTRYIINYAKHATTSIDDNFGFFKTSIINNINNFLRRNERKEESFEEYLKRVLQ